MTSRFEPAQAIADAVLYEGYVLYPYRATSRKNQVRWQFGVLAPRSWCDAGGCENAWMLTECLVEPGASPRFEGRLRFLQLQRRSVEDTSGWRLDSLEVEGKLWTSWDEGFERTVDFTFAGETSAVVAFTIPGGREAEPIVAPSGTTVGRFVRERWPIHGEIRVTLTPVTAIGPLARLQVHVENLTVEVDPAASRDEVMRASMIGAHVLLGVDDGAFVSLLEPPEWASAAAKASTNVRLFPVIAGAQSTVVLASPIILYDHPQIAPESPGDLHDGTEIDEILTLRTLTLTDEEKRQARATDPRSAAIIDRVENMSPETLERLHGTMRSANPYVVGTRVILRPGARRTDAQDMFLVGRSATVHAVRVDLEGLTYVAVTLDDDPAADLKLEQSRFLYFYPDELEPAP